MVPYRRMRLRLFDGPFEHSRDAPHLTFHPLDCLHGSLSFAYGVGVYVYQREKLTISHPFCPNWSAAFIKPDIA